MLIDLFFFVVGCWAIRELFSLGHHIACISYLCCLLSVIWSALFNQDWNHMNIIDWLIQLGLKFVRHNQGLNLSQKNRITLYKYCLIIILRKKKKKKRPFRWTKNNLRLLYWPREYLFHDVKILINENYF